ncbi:hypothetical protein ACI2JN_25060 [Ochrobactrum teleogrylli]|uniref:hypothetical protein n=1 Tax=Ochrobactrum teleogrylli TaxID=2479765 RepID=UPI00384E3886
MAQAKNKLDGSARDPRASQMPLTDVSDITRHIEREIPVQLEQSEPGCDDKNDLKFATPSIFSYLVEIENPDEGGLSGLRSVAFGVQICASPLSHTGAEKVPNKMHFLSLMRTICFFSTKGLFVESADAM